MDLEGASRQEDESQSVLESSVNRNFWNNAGEICVELLKSTIPFARVFPIKRLRDADYDLGDFALDSIKAGLIVLGAMDLARYHEFGNAVTNFRIVRDFGAFAISSMPHFWSGLKESSKNLDEKVDRLREQYENNSSEVRGFDRALVAFDIIAEDKLAFILSSSAWFFDGIRDTLFFRYEHLFKAFEEKYWAGPTSPQHLMGGAGLTMLIRDYLKVMNSEGFARNRKVSSFLTAVAFSLAWEVYEFMDSFDVYAGITEDTCADLVFDFLGSGSVLLGDQLKYEVSRCYRRVSERLSRLARS